MTLESFKNRVKGPALAAGLGAAMFGAFSSAAHADSAKAPGHLQSPIAADYVTGCLSGNCAPTKAAQWSRQPQNSNGVGISVRLGTTEKLADTQIKSTLENAFRQYGVENTRFFFEQNDAATTGIYFHVRGGTKGSYFVNGEIFSAVKDIAGLANNKDPVLALNN